MREPRVTTGGTCDVNTPTAAVPRETGGKGICPTLRLEAICEQRARTSSAGPMARRPLVLTAFPPAEFTGVLIEARSVSSAALTRTACRIGGAILGSEFLPTLLFLPHKVFGNTRCLREYPAWMS